jgi:hypothetical protein
MLLPTSLLYVKDITTIGNSHNSAAQNAPPALLVLVVN